MHKAPDKIRVLIVDDSAFMRGLLQRRIETDDRFVVVDTASDGREGVLKVKQLKPEVVTLDIEMPGLNGLQALRQMLMNGSVPVLVVSASAEAGTVLMREALSIGAFGFVSKSRGFEGLHEKLVAACMASHPGLAGETRARIPQKPPQTPSKFRHSPPKAVVIGSSTGGPEALDTVLRHLPDEFLSPIFIAQHLLPTFTEALVERLNAVCRASVVVARDGQDIKPGVIYIAPGGKQTRIHDGVLRIAEDKGESLYRPSVDILAESALANYNNEVVGLILTGLGNDGTRAFLQVQQQGGMTIAQNEATSLIFGMPKSLIDAGGADEVLPLSEIGPRLRTLVT